MNPDSIRAAIDIGSNSCRLLVASVEGENAAPLFFAQRMTRLGNEEGRLSKESVEATLAAVSDFRREISVRFGDIPLYAFATSAVREAENCEALLRPLADMRVSVDVLSGEREARLALACLPKNGGCIDIGGGSTELIYRGTLKFEASFPMGAVRAARLYAEDNADEFTDKLREIFGGARGLRFPPPVYGVGGTITTLAAMADGQRAYDAARVEGFVLTRKKLGMLIGETARVLLEKRKKLPLLSERFDTIVFGARILAFLMDLLSIDSVLASERDNLHSYLIRITSTAPNTMQ